MKELTAFEIRAIAGGMDMTGEPGSTNIINANGDGTYSAPGSSDPNSDWYPSDADGNFYYD